MWLPTTALVIIHCVGCAGRGVAQNGHHEIGRQKRNDEIQEERDNDMKDSMNVLEEVKHCWNSCYKSPVQLYG
jgi:hypothetical protein